MFSTPVLMLLAMAVWGLGSPAPIQCSAITVDRFTNVYGSCARCAPSAEIASFISEKVCKGCVVTANIQNCNPDVHIALASNGGGHGKWGGKSAFAFGSTTKEASDSALYACNLPNNDEDGNELAPAGGCRVVKVI